MPLLVLWFGAKDKNFTTPPTQEEITQTVREWRRKHPPLPPRKVPVESIPTAADAEPEEQAPAIAAIPEGDLDISPALDHFIEHAQFGSAAFIQLAKKLEEDKLPGYALLAWERVLDSTRPTTEEHIEASLSNLRLRLDAPAWNVDEGNNIDIVLHLSVPEGVKKEISGMVAQITADIRTSSSYQIAPQVLITTAEQRPGFPAPPMAIWLSGTGENAPETPKLTASVTPAIGQTTEITPAILESKVYSALYRAIASRLQQQNQLTPPADLTETTPARQALTSNITRLHWHNLAHSLNGKTKPKAKKKEKEEEQEEH